MKQKRLRDTDQEKYQSLSYIGSACYLASLGAIGFDLYQGLAGNGFQFYSSPSALFFATLGYVLKGTAAQHLPQDKSLKKTLKNYFDRKKSLKENTLPLEELVE